MFDFLRRRKKEDDTELDEFREKIMGKEQEAPSPPSMSPMGPDTSPQTKNDIEPLGYRRERAMGHPETQPEKPPDIPEVPSQDSRKIMDRLSFIENQLVSIRSQTETVNERLKNIQTDLKRKY